MRPGTELPVKALFLFTVLSEWQQHCDFTLRDFCPSVQNYFRQLCRRREKEKLETTKHVVSIQGNKRKTGSQTKTHALLARLKKM